MKIVTPFAPNLPPLISKDGGVKSVEYELKVNKLNLVLGNLVYRYDVMICYTWFPFRAIYHLNQGMSA